MDISIYDQKGVLNEPGLADRLLDVIVRNLKHLFGDDMGSESNRNEWKKYNLFTSDPTWHVSLASHNGETAGFIIYTVKDRVLTVNDIEIDTRFRFSPFLIIAMFRSVIARERDDFDTIRGYINKANAESQSNFMRFASSVSELAHGYRLTVDERECLKLKERFGGSKRERSI